MLSCLSLFLSSSISLFVFNLSLCPPPPQSLCWALPPHGSSSRTGFPPPETQSSSPDPDGPGWLHLPPKVGRRQRATLTPDSSSPFPGLVCAPTPFGGRESSPLLRRAGGGPCLGGLPSTLSRLLPPTPHPPDLSIGSQVVLGLQPQVGFILEPGVGGHTPGSMLF